MVGPDGRRLAEGEAGELWIGGVQVAHGYLGDPALTERAFVTAGGQRWYRTGDLARIDRGQVYYLGRIDAQLKVRGVRIEPGEVEAVLRQHPMVDQAVVVSVPPPDGGSPDLVAVAVPANRSPRRGRARAHLRQAAAARGVRAAPAVLDRQSSGHLRRQGRPPADRGAGGRALGGRGGAGRGHGDAVAEHWWRTLGTPVDQRREDVGFLNLGGHSLTAAQLPATLTEAGYGEAPPSVLLRDNLSLAGLRDLLATRVTAAPRPVGAPDPDHRATARRQRSPLTPAQEPLWVLSRWLDDPSGYNVVGSLYVPADLDDEVLLEALRDVSDRHDMLRAAITVTDGVPGWSYAPRAEIRLRSTVAEEPLTHDRVTRFVGGMARTPIPTDQPALMNLGVLHGPDRRDSVLTVVLHHLIADQRTTEIVLHDIATAYAARSAGKAPQWTTPAPSYADFAHEQAAAVGTGRYEADLAYWERMLRDAPVRTPMPFQLDGPGTVTRAARSAVVDLGPDLTRAIDRLLARLGHTTATYFLACVASVVAAWSGEPAVTIGMPVSQRLRPGDFHLVGHVLATVPVRLAAEGHSEPLALLNHVRDRRVEAAEHATPSFPAIVRRLGMPLSLRDNPLFQVWVNDLSRVGPAPALAGVQSRWVEAAPPSALFDINFYVRRGAHRLGNVETDDDAYRLECTLGEGRYPDEVADELLRQVVEAAARFAGHDTPAPLSVPAPAPVTPEPVRAPAAPVTSPADLAAAVRDVARAHPERVAIVSGTDRWTFADLLDRVDEVAAAVAAAGITPGDVLHLLATRSIALPVALLGAWTAGATVAISDASEPPEVLAEQADLLRAKAVVRLSPDPPLVEIAAGHPSPRRLDGISHVLFTSGTSGRPAAVRVPPAALAVTLRWYTDVFQLGTGDRVAMLGGLGHDPLLRDILAVLLAAGTLVVPPQDIFTAPAALFRLLREQRITVLNATPALLELILAGRPRTRAASRSWASCASWSAAGRRSPRDWYAHCGASRRLGWSTRTARPKPRRSPPARRWPRTAGRSSPVRSRTRPSFRWVPGWPGPG